MCEIVKKSYDQGSGFVYIKTIIPTYKLSWNLKNSSKWYVDFSRKNSHSVTQVISRNSKGVNTKWAHMNNCDQLANLHKVLFHKFDILAKQNVGD